MSVCMYVSGIGDGCNICERYIMGVVGVVGTLKAEIFDWVIYVIMKTGHVVIIYMVC